MEGPFNSYVMILGVFDLDYFSITKEYGPTLLALLRGVSNFQKKRHDTRFCDAMHIVILGPRCDTYRDTCLSG